MIRAVVVDDEAPARHRLRGLLSAFDDLEVVGEAADGREAVETIASHHPDLVFMDIQMPGLSGMQVAASLPPPRPRIIFCTAYDQYAVDAFEHHALDYLLKPLSKARLARALERVRQEMDVSATMHRELTAASDTQARLFPRTLPCRATLDYAGVSRSANGVGGDYYDFLAVDGDHLGIALADVSGKGLFAGLIMAGLQARVQSMAPASGARVDRMASEINQVMHSSTEASRYATFFYGLYDDRSRLLTYVNAGHVSPILLRRGGDGWKADRLAPTGTVLGLLPEAVYRRDTVQLESGDLLLLFTDGLVEAQDPGADEYGEPRLIRAARDLAGLSAEGIRDGILDAVERFRATAAQPDDMTLVVAKVR